MGAWRIVPARWHGALDYPAAIALMLAPFVLGLSPAARSVSLAVGALLVFYSLATDYALGAVRLLSMRIHLALDVAAGLFLLVASFVLDIDSLAQAYLIAMGTGVFGAVAITAPDVTDTQPLSLNS